jgi:hypothetical protein
MKAVFDWSECDDLTDNCVAYRINILRNVAAVIYFIKYSEWSGAPSYNAQINLPHAYDDMPWHGNRFDTLDEAKRYIDTKLSAMGYETLPAHLKILL